MKGSSLLNGVVTEGEGVVAPEQHGQERMSESSKPFDEPSGFYDASETPLPEEEAAPFDTTTTAANIVRRNDRRPSDVGSILLSPTVGLAHLQSAVVLLHTHTQ